MNAFESFFKKPVHDSVETPSQPENVTEFGKEWERQHVLIEEAKTKYEGIILYAPRAEAIKTKIISRLESTLMDSNQIDLFRDTHQGPFDAEHDAIRASLWVDRKMRGCIATFESELSSNDFKILTTALEGLTIPEKDRSFKVSPHEEEGTWSMNWKDT